MRVSRLLSVAAMTLALSPPAAAAPAPTARQVVERIKAHLGVPWPDPTVDTFKAGDPDTPITGVATTFMATLDVLQRASAAGANFVITHEPTFFNHLDETGELASERDAVYGAKQAFIREHHMVVWRFHDAWHRRNPDGIQEGVVHALGWDRYRVAGDPLLFVLPPTRLDVLAADVASRLGVQAMRFVGPPDATITRVALLPGAWGFAPHRKALQRRDVDAMLIGEAQEWETIEYVVDAIAAGLHKALIVAGHVPSEQPGMDECAAWLRTFVSDVPVAFVATSEPWHAVPGRK